MPGTTFGPAANATSWPASLTAWATGICTWKCAGVAAAVKSTRNEHLPPAWANRIAHDAARTCGPDLGTITSILRFDFGPSVHWSGELVEQAG